MLTQPFLFEAQNAQLEKKQHESWVTVRQESRKLTEAQNEMQTLRTRLTVAESKLAEKHVEIEKIMEENRAMKETMDRINNHQILKPEASKLLFSLFKSKHRVYINCFFAEHLPKYMRLWT